LDNLSQPFRDRTRTIDRGEMTRALAILAVVIVLAWLLVRVRTVRERRRAYHGPLRLFLSLCKAHHLAWSERWLLWGLARARRLNQPARLFLEPQWFDAAGLGRAWRARAARLRAIRDRLFAAPHRAEEEQDPLSPAAPSRPKRPAPALDIGPWLAGPEATTLPAPPVTPEAR
jgi:hypothetical protein